MPARRGFPDAAFDGRNPVFGNGPSENIVDEFDALVPLGGFEFDSTNTELAMSAGLFLVLSFGVGLAANRFAVGYLGRLERQVDVVTLLQLGNDDLNVLLSVAREEKFLGLWLAGEAQRWVLLHDLVNGHPDLVFIGAGLRFDRKCDGRLRKIRGRIVNRGGFVAERVSGNRFL